MLDLSNGKVFIALAHVEFTLLEYGNERTWSSWRNGIKTHDGLNLHLEHKQELVQWDSSSSLLE